MTYRSLRGALIGAPILGTLAFLAACSGGKVSNGTLASTSQAVSVGAVSGTVTECKTGFAHPNVCCNAGAGQAASCVVFPDAPFTQCQTGTTTYPDPRSCCPIDGNGACEAPPPVGTSPPPSGCGYACPVGFYSGSSSGECCAPSTNGGAETCGSYGGSSTGCGCACPGCAAGTECAPCVCNCPEEPACNTCPPGWQVPEGEPLLCCSEDPSGAISCFSQGTPPSVGTSPASCFGSASEGGSSSGGTVDAGVVSQCGCSETVGSDQYSVTCSTDASGASTCECQVQSSNAGGGFSIPQPAGACADEAALFGACNFPIPTNGGVAGGSSSGWSTLAVPDAGSGASGGSSSSSGG